MTKYITLIKLAQDIVSENIKDFELNYKFQLPGSLKSLLLKYNVCKPIKTYYKKNNLEFNLNYFFGITQDIYQSLSENYDTYGRRMPNELFPIGSVDGGDLICMNKITEEIYYWFHETDDWGIDGVYQWPVKVADNIEKFVDQLTLRELPSQLEIETARKNSKVKITSISVKIKNEQREKQGLPPLTLEEWEIKLNN